MKSDFPETLIHVVKQFKKYFIPAVIARIKRLLTQTVRRLLVKYLSRYEIREIIKKCFSYHLTLSQIKETVRVREIREMEERTERYGWR